MKTTIALGLVSLLAYLLMSSGHMIEGWGVLLYVLNHAAWKVTQSKTIEE